MKAAMFLLSESIGIDDERMRHGNCLGSVMCVPFSDLTLLVG